MTRWYLRGDSPLVQARRLALAYRAIALDAAPERAAELDAAVRGAGQAYWLVGHERRAYPTDALLTPAEAAALVGVAPARLNDLVRLGRLRRYSGQGWRKYRAGDIYDLSSEIRPRAVNRVG